MYPRKHKVKVGEQRRTYLSIAHNVWWTGRHDKAAQSRPVVLASFGAEEKTDVALARELVGIVENVSPRYGLRRGDGKEATMKLAREIMENFASGRLGRQARLPVEDDDRN